VLIVRSTSSYSNGFMMGEYSKFSNKDQPMVAFSLVELQISFRTVFSCSVVRDRNLLQIGHWFCCCQCLTELTINEMASQSNLHIAKYGSISIF
jgi:hypothetical protein